MQGVLDGLDAAVKNELNVLVNTLHLEMGRRELNRAPRADPRCQESRTRWVRRFASA
jgi:hypothetical protein